jgi:exonuclease VII large subunit
MIYTNTTKLGNKPQEWFKALDFYKNELEILKERLAEVNNKNTGIESRVAAEHFQNQFDIQENNISELKHAINRHAHMAFEDAKQHMGRVEETRIVENKRIERDIMEFENVMKDLRLEFNKYLAKWF